MTKRFALVLAIVALAAFLLPTAAFANFAIHGNYVTDTDACAGCHRAHTSVSTITWQDAGANNHSALLISSATEMWQFCYACHDATGQGADTNVQTGVYEGTQFGTQFAVLNGGGFESLDTTVVTSTHMYKGASWGAYGGGYAGQGKVGANGQIPGADVGESVPIKMDCTTCHDPHGSSNYRILKSMVNGNYVGGYQDSGDPQYPTPDGFVSSVETGWPATGFELHTAYPGYQPNYTTPMYAKGYNQPAGSINDTKGMSGWCAGCHSVYLEPVSTFTKSDGSTYQSSASIYNAGDGAGLKLRHRHPINVALNTYNGADAGSMIVNSGLPLAHDLSEEGNPTNASSDWIECLTCHRAHGTSAIMTGYAANPGAYDLPPFPADQYSLLRRDNRGVCEACHNK
jgi:cytochrome c553